jgi:hypothetical protein
MAFYQVLELAAAHDPVRLRDLLASPQPGAAPAPLQAREPRQLETGRPWRA